MSDSVAVRGEVIDTGSLAENEAVIRKGLSTFVDVGRALARIRDEAQYVEAGFDSFEDYCRQRWDFAKSTVSGYIGAVRVVEVVRARELDPPVSEFASRPLVQVLNEHGEQAAAEAWLQIVDSHEGDGPITGREVRRFFTIGGNYAKPGWRELLGQVGDTLLKAQKEFERYESAVADREIDDELREKAARYAEWAEGLATALRRAA